MGAFLERLRQAAPTAAWDALDAAAGERLERFAAACPLYARLLEQTPDLALELESRATRDTMLALDTLLDEIQRRRAAGEPMERTAAAYPGFLRRFRRRTSLRIAYRDVADFAPQDVIVEELTRLAELMIRECYFIAIAKADERWGEPWDESGERRARFAVLALGKLGGRELNFSSDVDLIYLYEGEGRTRRDGAPTGTTNAEYFQRVAEHLTQLLNDRDADGFLFRADLRLRPGGAAAALVPSVESAENYYAATGQTWERLALLKARTVAGDFAVGGELLESLHSFRYPRHPPASLLAEVAAMKQRTEREVLGAGALERNLKSGYGGIREIEFLTQVLQLLHAARYPFLQTHSTTEALRQLARYDLLAADDAHFLTEAYWFLRRIEHRVQMAEEQQTHELPESDAARAAIARSLGSTDVAAFDARLALARHRVRALYARLFSGEEPPAADPADPWWPFFAENRANPAVQARLAAWFGEPARDESARSLRLFVRGEETWPLVREQVQRFAGLVPALDRILPQLARPGATLGRISAFADRYASRNQFLAACTLNPEFFEVLARLFDRSRFIAELLTAHPEILEEVLRPEVLRKRKDAPARRRELAAHAGSRADDLASWLWLYVRAEQLRTVIGQLLGFVADDDVGAELTRLGEAVLQDAIARTPGAEELLFVALGTLGGAELSFGSDLDLVVLGREGGPVDEARTRAVLQWLGGGSAGREPVYRIDLRLRPHGEAGPLVPTIAAYREYFARSARPWERQVLTRARLVAGPDDLRPDWEDFVARTIYGGPLPGEQAAALWQMRQRVQTERDIVRPPERAFKTAAGGLVDIEFAAQILMLRHGSAHPAVRLANTREAWRQLAAAGLVADADATLVLEHHRHLQRLEWTLRGDANRPVTILPDGADEQRALAQWLGAASWPEFWADHCRRLGQTREAVLRVLAGVVPSTALETSR